MKKEIDLQTGKLEVTTVWNDQLVLAEVTAGRVVTEELFHALAEAGINGGLLVDNVDLLANGFKGQIPVAVARVVYEVSGLKFHFEPSLTAGIFKRWMETGKPEELDLACPVARGERLITLSSPPREVLRYPNGRKTVLRQRDMDSIHYYAGERVVRGIHKQSLVADMDGYAYRNPFGVVSVYPMHTVAGIGKKHGPIPFDKVLTVENEVQKNSCVEVTAHLIIHGPVRSSVLKAGGNIRCAAGLEGDGDAAKSSIHAGQVLQSPFVRNYRVRSGHLIAGQRIETSDVECLNTVYAGMISNSEIRVGNKLYVYGDIRTTRIHMGLPFVKDPELKERNVYFDRKRKRLEKLFYELSEQKRNLEARRTYSIAHIEKLRKISPDLLRTDGLLSMQLRTLKSGSDELRKQLTEVKDLLETFQRLSLSMYIDEAGTAEHDEPEIVVRGEIDPDVDIIGPTGELKEKHHLRNVSVRLNASTGRFDITPLKWTETE